MKNKSHCMKKITKLLDEQKFCVLSTRSEKYPYTTLVGFYVNVECNEMIFGTMNDTRKYKNLINYPLISALVTDRKNSYLDIKDAAALTVLGEAHEIKENIKMHADSFISKHPYMEDFINTPNCALFMVKVERYILVENFQNVYEFVL